MNKSMDSQVFVSIKTLRLDNKYSEEYIAAMLGVSQEMVSLIEKGKNRLSLEQGVRLADLYSVSLDCLCEREEKYQSTGEYHTLKELRERHGYTSGELGKILSISKSGYSRIENGNRRLTIEYAIILADLYSLSLDDLVGRKFVSQR